MDLEEWASLAPEQQRELILKKASDAGWGEQHRQMAEKAAKLLKGFLSQDPRVTDVQLGCGEFYNAEPLFPALELLLNVCTTASKAPRLELPQRFKGFRVCQFDYGPQRDAYIRTWKRLFKELKGWSEAETLRWVEYYIDALEGGLLSTVVYSHGPITTAIAALINKPRNVVCDERYWKLYNEIRTMIWDTSQRCAAILDNQSVNHPDLIENYDWDFVRNRYIALMEEYNSTPPA